MTGIETETVTGTAIGTGTVERDAAPVGAERMIEIIGKTVILHE